ncbi:MAG: hypothetical protein COV29_04150 [Candidatus Yanofskybacteria bacterium CG10_big_fil_rev_8_21_14_0_10_36_16]|uniref:Uncharacterized protein n=1 Tax=Candidatus Yanofskybacteria bacterium CG10_big_fil_rev_8_21_14_0_10_36_16 TaxID=1975096 RepID=A0A2J0Q6B7_9BACT|nr:MAG: hypothetical protein COV29_04150 [Candidatus Yanofskybacteria bacterium CG10_big_fil_rev_8_21_14_0_10_36_16]
MNHICDDCHLCIDKDDIAYNYISDEALEQACFSQFGKFLAKFSNRFICSKIVKIGLFSLPNWKGHAPFYVFDCLFCGNVNIDYAHGYTSEGLLYLSCNKCDSRVVLTIHKFYKENDCVPPPSFLESIKILFKLIFFLRKKT